MLKRIDRVQVVVKDAPDALATYEANFQAVQILEDEVECLGAYRTIARLGTSRVELLQPARPGPVQDFMDQCGEGLFAAGFAADDVEAVHERIKDKMEATLEGEQLFFKSPVGGLRGVVSKMDDEIENAGAQGVISRLYEVTNVVADWQGAKDFYVDAFGLDESKFVPIGSDVYAYTGMLTRFDPPQWLDRIEITQSFDASKPMGRFHARRGDSFYMCFAETDDFDGLQDRLKKAGAQFQARIPEDGPPNVLFVHPKSLHGMLMGVSAKDVAWTWSQGQAHAETAPQ